MAAAAAVSGRGKAPFIASNFGRAGADNVFGAWIAGAVALPAAGMEQ